MTLPVKYDSLKPIERRKVRMEYVKRQDNKCFFCGGNLDEQPSFEITDKKIDLDLFPPNFLKYPIHLQHDHNLFPFSLLHV